MSRPVLLREGPDPKTWQDAGGRPGGYHIEGHRLMHRFGPFRDVPAPADPESVPHAILASLVSVLVVAGVALVVYLLGWTVRP